MYIIDVPIEFRPEHPVRYPDHHVGPRLQDISLKYFTDNKGTDDWVYLPIFWNNYFVVHSFGKDPEAMNLLKDYYGETVKKYSGRRIWTLCEYADGILFDTPELTVFSCGGPGNKQTRKTYPLPLLCDPHPVNRTKSNKYIATFVGNINTHPCRLDLLRIFGDRPGWYVGGTVNTQQFECLMDNSCFALCPRGYGPTSYRLYEAIQMGCVPVYIGDEFWLPYKEEIEWNSFCKIVPINEISMLAKNLETTSKETIETMQNELHSVYESHFTMLATVKYIERTLFKT